MKAKTMFTRGPWHFNQELSRQRNQLVYGEDHYLIANVGAFDRSDIEDQSNAHLISAAPDMYEVLRAFEIQLAHTQRLDDITVDVIRDMILALRKAEGTIP